jgi:hypothetical protein
MEDLKNVLKENLEFYLEQEKIIVSRLSVLPKGRIKERKQLEEELKKVRAAIKLLNKKNDSESDFSEPIRQILAKFTELGLWESGIEIIGSWCFLIYQKYLPLEKYPLKTQDIDFLIPLPYNGKAFDFSAFFRQIGFREHFNPDGSMFFATPALKVEFLAPQKGKGEKSSQYITDLAVSPQLLRFMDILLKETATFRISRNIKVRLPSPSSFFLHKLLISIRSSRRDKKEKDIRQAIYTGKFVFMDTEEKSKLLIQWEDFSNSWKSKVRRALCDAHSLIPLEAGFSKQVERILH